MVCVLRIYFICSSLHLFLSTFNMGRQQIMCMAFISSSFSLSILLFFGLLVLHVRHDLFCISVCNTDHTFYICSTWSISLKLLEQKLDMNGSICLLILYYECSNQLIGSHWGLPVECCCERVCNLCGIFCFCNNVHNPWSKYVIPSSSNSRHGNP